MRTLLPILLVMVGIGLPATVDAQQTRERFLYDVSWGGSGVADMRIDVGCQRGKHIPAALVATSTGVANQLHSFDIRLDSFFVPLGRSLEGRTRITEEGEARKFRSRFKSLKSVKVTKEFRGETTEKAFRLPGASHDLLSWMIHLRFREISPGKRYSYWVWDGWKLSKIEARVEEPKTIVTGLGTKKAHSIALHRTVFHHGGPKIFSARGEREELGTLWVGTDEARTPWAMSFDAPIGTAKIVLQSATRRACAKPADRSD